MSTPAITPVPEHLHTVTPRLVVSDGAAAIAFYVQAFGAEEVGERFTTPSGEIVHAEVRVGDSIVKVSEDAGDTDPPTRAPGPNGGEVTALMVTYWPDVDAVWARATAAGAEVIYPLADQFYGDRAGRLRDPFGQQWMLCQRIEILTSAQLEQRAQEFFGSAG